MSLKSFSDIDKVIANILVKQSELDNSHILNGLSIRGPELVKYIEDSIEMSPDLSDTFLIFINSIDDNAVNFTEEVENSTTIRSTNTCSCHIYLYGSSSINVALKLKARLESEYVRLNMYENGVELRKVESPQATTELINNTMWSRADLEFSYYAEFIISPVDKFKNMSQSYNDEGIDVDTI